MITSDDLFLKYCRSMLADIKDNGARHSPQPWFMDIEDNLLDANGINLITMTEDALDTPTFTRTNDLMLTIVAVNAFERLLELAERGVACTSKDN